MHGTGSQEYERERDKLRRRTSSTRLPPSHVGGTGYQSSPGSLWSTVHSGFNSTGEKRYSFTNPYPDFTEGEASIEFLCTCAYCSSKRISRVSEVKASGVETSVAVRTSIFLCHYVFTSACYRCHIWARNGIRSAIQIPRTLRVRPAGGWSTLDRAEFAPLMFLSDQSVQLTDSVKRLNFVAAIRLSEYGSVVWLAGQCKWYFRCW